MNPKFIKTQKLPILFSFVLSYRNGLTPMLGLLFVGPLNSYHGSANHFRTQAVIVFQKHPPTFSWIYAPVQQKSCFSTVFIKLASEHAEDYVVTAIVLVVFI